MSTGSNRRKGRLLKRVRKQRLKYITVLPSLITLLNGLFGFASIVFASRIGWAHTSIHNLDHTNFAWAGYMIFIAMIADVLDGRVARMSHTTSSFGGQLDSLCDMISFGVAPSFLMLKIMRYYMGEFLDPTDMAEPFLIKFIWISSGLFLTCTAIRLARFNVENEEDETSHMFFSGLPSPAAAGAVTSIVIFQQYIEPAVSKSSFFEFAPRVTIYVLPFAAIMCSLLMISRVRYPHLVNLYLRGRKPISYLLSTLLIAGLIWWSVETSVVLIFCGYMLWGLIRWIYLSAVRKLRRNDNSEPTLTTSTSFSSGQ